jgi:hypothetical protein
MHDVPEALVARIARDTEPTRTTRRSMIRAVLGLPLALLAQRLSAAGGIEQFYKFNIRPEVFLEEIFGPDVPQAQSVAVSGNVAQMIQPLPQRMRYWRAGGRTVWIFDELGKVGYQPTTCAFVVRDKAIERAKVLVYRESRGEQVGQPSFLQQLVGARASGSGIDKSVDNISGATYSVKMMQRMARTALMLDELAV